MAVKGDWGAGTAAQQAVTARMCEVRKTRPFSVVLTTGDNFYDPDGVATSRTYYRPERCLTAARNHQWRAAWGNHDLAGDSTARVLGSNQRFFAWSEAGADFFVLDSNRAGDQAQRAWLEGGLTASRASVKIVAFHHPPFTVGATHPNDLKVQRSWVPILERAGVTLVLNGHSHLYEHSRVNGLDYVVTGGGGAALYRCGPAASWNLKCLRASHFLLLEVRPTDVTVTAIDAGGATIDAFTIQA